MVNSWLPAVILEKCQCSGNLHCTRVSFMFLDFLMNSTVLVEIIEVIEMILVSGEIES